MINCQPCVEQRIRFEKRRLWHQIPANRLDWTLFWCTARPRTRTRALCTVWTAFRQPHTVWWCSDGASSPCSWFRATKDAGSSHPIVSYPVSSLRPSLKQQRCSVGRYLRLLIEVSYTVPVNSCCSLGDALRCLRRNISLNDRLFVPLLDYS